MQQHQLAAGQHIANQEWNFFTMLSGIQLTHVVACLGVGISYHVATFFACYDTTINSFNGDFDKVISCRNLAVPLMDRIKLKGIEAQPQVTKLCVTKPYCDLRLDKRAARES
jgi:hypothetical protein